MITLENDKLIIRCPEVHGEAIAELEFQRTLRIPDDDRDHSLPAGLGRFPVRHVEDFAERLDEKTLARGGVMMPMHRSEAMWLNFGGGRPKSERYPFAIKVAAGKINALTGGAWSPELSDKEQDYIVIPVQPWLDGFAVAKGIIRQFVAERLGEGFSAEEQLTGKAEFGGLQIIAYPMKAERYRRLMEERAERAAAERARREEAQREAELRKVRFWKDFCDDAREGLDTCRATLEEIRHLSNLLARDDTSKVPDAPEVRRQIRQLLSKWRGQVSGLSELGTRTDRLALDREDLEGLHDGIPMCRSEASPHFSRPKSPSMGLGGGGRMRQEVFTDPYGVEAWDQAAGSRCFIHMIEATGWSEVTGEDVPTEPPTQAAYKKNGLPWFDYYAPQKPAQKGAKLLAGLKSWGAFHGKPKVKAGEELPRPIQLGTAPRPRGVVSEGQGQL